MLCAMSQETFEPPLNRPVLPGDARTDYERYLNTEELLALQKGPDLKREDFATYLPYPYMQLLLNDSTHPQ